MGSYHQRRRRRKRSDNSLQLFILLGLMLAGAVASYGFYLEDVVKYLFIAVLILIPCVIGFIVLKRYIRKLVIKEEHILRKSINDFFLLTPFEFEKFVGWMFEKMDYKVEVTKAAGDHGLDALLKKEGKAYAVQVKRYSIHHKVSEPEVRDFYGSFADMHLRGGYFITTSDFTDSARAWAKGKSIDLINGKELAHMVQDLGASSPRQLIFGAVLRKR